MLYSYAMDIILWNEFAGKTKNTYTQKDINKQRELCKAEFKEFLDEISYDIIRDSDISDNLKAEAADMFVTTIFLEFMGNDSVWDWSRDIDQDSKIQSLISTIDEFMVENKPELTSDLVWSLVIRLGADKHLEAVCKSNWTKIPTPNEFLNKPLPRSIEAGGKFYEELREAMKEEEKAIAEKNKGRYTGIKGEIVTVVGKGMRVVFKDDNDKVLKPYTFKGYKEFL